MKLKLASPASKVTLSTVNMFTNFDTSLYLLTACGTNPPACTDPSCKCADDVAGPPANVQSILTLTNLPAGDHLIVVDSVPSRDAVGNRFELTVTIQ